MSTTKIQWADKVWNPVTGCTPISEGCANCYAARMARRLAGRYGYPKDEPFKPGTYHLDKDGEPAKWAPGQRVFVCSMGDIFHDNVGLSALWDIFWKMRQNQGHTWMILTKRPSRMAEFFRRYPNYGYPENLQLWLGVTAENQRTADERIPILLQIPAAKRFVSVEPMLGPVDLNKDYGWEHPSEPNTWCHAGLYGVKKLDWVIAGPETGPGARPCNIDWVRDLSNQCKAASVPFFDKKDVLGETIQEWPR